MDTSSTASRSCPFAPGRARLVPGHAPQRPSDRRVRAGYPEKSNGAKCQAAPQQQAIVAGFTRQRERARSRSFIPRGRPGHGRGTRRLRGQQRVEGDDSSGHHRGAERSQPTSGALGCRILGRRAHQLPRRDRGWLAGGSVGRNGRSRARPEACASPRSRPRRTPDRRPGRSVRACAAAAGALALVPREPLSRRRRAASVRSSSRRPWRASPSARSAAFLRSPHELSAALLSRVMMRRPSRWCPRRISNCPRASLRSFRTRSWASASIFRSARRSESWMCFTDRASWWIPFWTSARPA